MYNEIIRQLQSDYEEQQALNAREEVKRLREAVTACPEIGALQQERRNLISRGVLGILNGQGSAEDLPARMDVINRRIVALLKQNGYSGDWLEPVYRCKACKDTGYVGEPIREMCTCMRGRYYQKLYQSVGLSSGNTETFETYDPKVFSEEQVSSYPISQRAAMEMIRAESEEFANSFPDTELRFMVLSGASGLGKTFLLHAMAHRLLERGKNVLLLSAYRLIDISRKAYFSGNTEELESIMAADVLLVDDLGSEPLMENVTIVQLFNLINERMIRNKATVFSTNLTVEELRARYTERIASRILDSRCSRLMRFEGCDIRHPQGGKS